MNKTNTSIFEKDLNRVILDFTYILNIYKRYIVSDKELEPLQNIKIRMIRKINLNKRVEFLKDKGILKKYYDFLFMLWEPYEKRLNTNK